MLWDIRRWGEMHLIFIIFLLGLSVFHISLSRIVLCLFFSPPCTGPSSSDSGFSDSSLSLTFQCVPQYLTAGRGDRSILSQTFHFIFAELSKRQRVYYLPKTISYNQLVGDLEQESRALFSKPLSRKCSLIPPTSPDPQPSPHTSIFSEHHLSLSFP